MTTKISLRAQVEEVDYELKMRGEVYPGLVRKGRYRQSEADLHVARMQAVRATLLWLGGDEEFIRFAVANKEAIKQKMGTPDTALDQIVGWMAGRGYATGHGDTVADLLAELEGQAKNAKTPPPA